MTLCRQTILNPPKAERNRRVVDDYQAGLTRDELARKYKISRSRVQQILFRATHGTMLPLKYQEHP